MYLIGIEKIKTGNLDSGEYDEININIAITPADEPTIDIFNSLKTGNKLYANSTSIYYGTNNLAGGGSIGTLSDVTISNLQNNQILKI